MKTTRRGFLGAALALGLSAVASRKPEVQTKARYIQPPAVHDEITISFSEIENNVVDLLDHKYQDSLDAILRENDNRLLGLFGKFGVA